MGVINERSAAITALFKYYHSDQSRFLTTVSTATEYPHEIYAATTSTSATTKTNIIRFVKNSASAWVRLQLADPASTASFTEGLISGVVSGQFARMGNKVYFSNGLDTIKMIRPRISAGDGTAKYIYEAGVPDPNSKLVYDSMEDTSQLTYDVGDGAGTAYITYSIQHRREGKAAIVFNQTTPSKTATLTITGTDVNFATFADGQTASGDDYVAFECYRFDKVAISNLYVDCVTTAGNYYRAYVAYESSLTNPFSGTTTWNNWHPVQTTSQAQWANNLYDNQLFKVRIRKNYFQKVGSPTWTAISSMIFHLKASSKASTTRPAQVAIDYVRTMKSPPKVSTNRINVASCEHVESGSTNGWVSNTATNAAASFSYEMAREGMSCVYVAHGAKAVLKFDTPRDLGTFPDGTTADTTCVLRCNVSSKGLGYQAGFNWSAFTCPTITFTDNAGLTHTAKLFTMGNFTGGGICKQVLMHNTTYWTGDATFDWTNVDNITLNGPSHATITVPDYYFDDIRIERPYDGQMPVYIFEPIERYVIDAATEFLGATFKDLAWAVDLTGEALKFVFGNLSYHTYGMGWMTYPDFEHSSIGLAGCTLTSYGSKPFGCRFKFTGTHDLTNYKIPVVNYPPSWTNFPDELGPIKWVDIPAGTNDKFYIWIAAPKDSVAAIDRVYIRLHGNNSGALDPETYLEYSISGQELEGVMKEQYKEQSEFKKFLKDVNKTYDKYQFQTINALSRAILDPGTGKGEFNNLANQAIQYIGLDRGGWPSAIFSWNRKDMVTCENSSAGRQFSMAAVRGISIELVGKGSGARICVDNFMMKKEGSLNGDYSYVVLLEDNDGQLSPATEQGKSGRIVNGDAVVTNIYVPTGANASQVVNKRIYRIGGTSDELRYAGDCAVNLDTYYDRVPDNRLGAVAPEDAYKPPVCKVMEPYNNMMYYGNIVKDRFNETFPYRIVVSEAFVPFRVKDYDAMDIPEDGHKGGGIVGIKGYYNQVVVWTEESMWTVPPGLKQGAPVYRGNRGLIARDSIAVTPYGLVWLSREGLMLGDISRIDDNFFRPINPVFENYTVTQLANAKGFCIGQYYYLFYNQDNTLGTGSGIVCYLPERQFGELSGPFDINSLMVWDGAGDNNDVYIGRGNGKIYKLFDGNTDDSTAITTTLRTREFSYPGIQYEKWLKAYYLSMANTQTSINSTITPTVYCNGTAKETMPIWTATLTTIKTFVQPAIMGDAGTHISVGLSGTGPHKITEMVLKVEVEPDIEYKAY